MQGFIARVTAYFGATVTVGGIPTRSAITWEVPITAPSGGAVNDPGVFPDDPALSVESLLEDFESGRGCMVAIGNDDHGPPAVRAFDVFHPSWGSADEARKVLDELIVRLGTWARALPC